MQSWRPAHVLGLERHNFAMHALRSSIFLQVLNLSHVLLVSSYTQSLRPLHVLWLEIASQGSRQAPGLHRQAPPNWPPNSQTHSYLSSQERSSKREAHVTGLVLHLDFFEFHLHLSSLSHWLSDRLPQPFGIAPDDGATVGDAAGV